MLKKILCNSQGIYYLITGIWPLVHIDSFMAVSGPKVDVWLVKMVGLLVTVIGVALIIHISKNKEEAPSEIIFLGLASAVSFLAVDVYYALIDRIWDVYLLDAVVQAILIVTWVVLAFSQKE